MNRSNALFATLSMLLAGACLDQEPAGSTDAPAEEAELRPLMTLPTETGSTLELYEVRPGVVIASEVASIGTPTTLGQFHHEDAQTIFETLKPAGVEATPELTAAFDRARALTAQQVAASSEDRAIEHDDSVEVTPYVTPYVVWNDYTYHGDNNSTWFYNTFCDDGDWQFCDLNRVGSSTKTRYDIVDGHCIVATYRNTARLSIDDKMFFSWDDLGSWNVKTGYYRDVYFGSGTLIDFDVECHVGTYTGCNPFDYACIVAAPSAAYHHAGHGNN